MLKKVIHLKASMMLERKFGRRYVALARSLEKRIYMLWFRRNVAVGMAELGVFWVLDIEYTKCKSFGRVQI